MIINYSYYRNRKVRVQFYLDYNKEVLALYLHVLYKYVTFSSSLFTFIIQYSVHMYNIKSACLGTVYIYSTAVQFH